MAARPPIKSTAINLTDKLNKQSNNQDVALELVKSYLASGAYKNKKLNTTDVVSVQVINTEARTDAYYIASLYAQLKERLDKIDSQ